MQSTYRIFPFGGSPRRLSRLPTWARRWSLGKSGSGDGAKVLERIGATRSWHYHPRTLFDCRTASWHRWLIRVKFQRYVCLTLTFRGRRPWFGEVPRNHSTLAGGFEPQTLHAIGYSREAVNGWRLPWISAPCGGTMEIGKYIWILLFLKVMQLFSRNEILNKEHVNVQANLLHEWLSIQGNFLNVI